MDHCVYKCARSNCLLFTGQVELENLPLKKDALKSLELPIEVKHGICFKNFVSSTEV